MARCDRRRHPHSDSWGHDVAGRAHAEVPELGHQVERHAPLPFTQAGTYGYVCTLRVEASMTGQVIVR
jgi:plastocyanin